LFSGLKPGSEYLLIIVFLSNFFPSIFLKAENEINYFFSVVTTSHLVSSLKQILVLEVSFLSFFFLFIIFLLLVADCDGNSEG